MRRFLIVLPLLLAACSTVPSKTVQGIPPVPQGAKLVGEKALALCSDSHGLVLRVYDLNPETEAAYYEVLVVEDVAATTPSLSAPIMTVVADDEGKSTVYRRDPADRRHVIVESFEAMREAFPNICDLPGAQRDKKI